MEGIKVKGYMVFRKAKVDEVSTQAEIRETLPSEFYFYKKLSDVFDDYHWYDNICIAKVETIGHVSKYKTMFFADRVHIIEVIPQAELEDMFESSDDCVDDDDIDCFNSGYFNTGQLIPIQFNTGYYNTGQFIAVPEWLPIYSPEVFKILTGVDLSTYESSDK